MYRENKERERERIQSHFGIGSQVKPAAIRAKYHFINAIFRPVKCYFVEIKNMVELYETTTVYEQSCWHETDGRPSLLGS